MCRAARRQGARRMACRCGKSATPSTLIRRPAPVGFPPLTPGGFFLEDRVWPGGGACPAALVDLTKSPAIAALERTGLVPVLSFLRAYCRVNGNLDAAGKRTACSLRNGLPISAAIYGAAGLIPNPLSPFL